MQYRALLNSCAFYNGKGREDICRLIDTILFDPDQYNYNMHT